MIDAASLKAVCGFVKTISNKQMESKIFDKIDLLEKKVDTILIRDLLAANAALDDIKAVGHGSKDMIAQIYKLYMSNTGLPLDQKTYGIANSKIVLASYFGLLQIGILQGEDENLLCRYVLHMFATGEEMVYKELCHSFYQSNYGNSCLHLVTEAEQRKKNWKNETALVGKYRRKAAVDEFLEPTIVFRTSDRVEKSMRVLAAYAAAGETEECKAFVHRNIESQLEKSIAKKCAQKANEQLSQKGRLLA